MLIRRYLIALAVAGLLGGGLLVWLFRGNPRVENAEDVAAEPARHDDYAQPGALGNLQQARAPLSPGESAAVADGGAAAALRRMYHSSSPYAEQLVAWQSRSLHGFSTARLLLRTCDVATWALSAPPSEDAFSVRGPVGAGDEADMQINAKQQSARQEIANRCTPVFQDMGRTKHPMADDANAERYLAAVAGLRLSTPLEILKARANQLLPEDFARVLDTNTSGPGDQQATPRYVDGKLWGGASSAEAYHRALMLAIYAQDFDAGSSTPHLRSLAVCARYGACQFTLDEMALADQPAGSVLRAEALALYPRIQQVIAQRDLGAFAPPR